MRRRGFFAGLAGLGSLMVAPTGAQSGESDSCRGALASRETTPEPSTSPTVTKFTYDEEGRLISVETDKTA